MGKEEDLLLKIERRKHILNKIKLKKEIKHYSFHDFAQNVIGVGVFGLPAFINTSFWDYLPNIGLKYMFYMHIFFIIAGVLTLNYEFRDDFPIRDKWYMIMFSKRVLFVYISVMIVILLLLGLVNKISWNMTMYHFLKNFFASQSIGLMGAVTFSFFKKE